MEPHEYSWGLPLASTKRPTFRRTASSSSEASHSSRNSLGSRGSEEQFAFSPLNTPAKEKPPARAMIPRYATDPRSDGPNDFFFGRANARRRASENTSTVANDRLISPSSASKPIAIELPETHPADPTSSVTSNPPEPLSARGDIPGGYFPLHEDPESRVRIPHPFHLDAEMARKNSLQRAAESSRAGTGTGTGTGIDSRASPPPRLTSRPSQFSLNNNHNNNNNNLTRATASPNTPISSYNPSGFHDDVVLPMGKYYPSNWERRHGKSPQQQQQQRPSTSGTLTGAPPAAPTFKSESQVPKYHHHGAGGEHGGGHARHGSDVKRRLQQYQRDMVAQAAMAAKAVLANSASPSMNTSSGSGSGSGSGLGGGVGMKMAIPSLPAAKLAAAFLKMHKPSAPRLQPLESPKGAVTPMSLEGEQGEVGCYLTVQGGSRILGAGGAAEGVVSPFGEGEEEEEDRVWMAGLGGKGKQRRRGSCATPPPMELGAVSV